ncbi:MAG TPA: ABC transporter, partial [Alcanivorax sp.]|nr:ABC transporter [Alcanivorax sp.]
TTRHFREALADDPRFVVPEVYGDYSTHNILCLSYEEGVHISDPSVVSLSQERRNFLGRAIMELC